MDNETHNHKVGDTVNIYQEPMNKRCLEGKAKIVEVRNTDHYYDVEFLDEPDAIFSRFVY